VATDGWRDLSLAAVAAALSSRSDKSTPLRVEAAILCGLYRRIDERCSPNPPRRGGEHGVIACLICSCRRFDALGPYKPAMSAAPRAGWRSADGDVRRWIVDASMFWMLAAADIATVRDTRSDRGKAHAGVSVDDGGLGEATTRRISLARWPCWTPVCGGSSGGSCRYIVHGVMESHSPPDFAAMQKRALTAQGGGRYRSRWCTAQFNEPP